jgi:hypothetical protein
VILVVAAVSRWCVVQLIEILRIPPYPISNGLGKVPLMGCNSHMLVEDLAYEPSLRRKS